MYEQASQVANDAVGSIRIVASFCAEDKVMDMYQKKCDGPMKSGIRLGIVSGAGLCVGSSVLFLVNSFIFYIGSVLEKHGKATSRFEGIHFSVVLEDEDQVELSFKKTHNPSLNKNGLRLNVDKRWKANVVGGDILEVSLLTMDEKLDPRTFSIRNKVLGKEAV